MENSSEKASQNKSTSDKKQATPPPNNETNSQPNTQIPKGEKTICCWNCLSVLMVKEEWNVVECTTCGKFNRIPSEDKNLPNSIQLNDNINHFELNIPYVFGIITCPFCQTENRFRRDSEHVICYKCHHSFNCVNNFPGPFNGKNFNTPNRSQSYQQMNSFSGPISIPSNPSGRVQRFSDYYPDIMQYRGYYPQPYIIQNCDCSQTEELLRKLLKAIKKKNKIKNYPPAPVDRYAPLRTLVRDIDDIDDRRKMNRYNSSSIGNNGPSAMERYKNDVYDEVYGGNQMNIRENYGNKMNRSSGDYLSMKNDAINKMMFLGGRKNNYFQNSGRYDDYL